MILRKVVVLLLACLAAGAVLSFSSPAMASIPARPGTIAATIAIEDGQPCVLDGMIFDVALGDFVFVHDPWNSQQLLAVWARVPAGAIRSWDSILVRGTKVTVQGQPVVVATSIQLYVDHNGRALPIYPKNPRGEPVAWDYVLDIPLGALTSPIPAVPDPTPPPVYAPPMIGDPGTIAGAKLSGAVEQVSTSPASSVRTMTSTPPQVSGGLRKLENKIVTAVIYAGNSQTVTSFYIQEREGFEGPRRRRTRNGIKVVPTVPVPVEAGNLVTVTGTVIPSGSSLAECYLSASSVKCNGVIPLPKPIATCSLSTASSAFGYQGALYLQTENQSLGRPAIDGAGLSLVGTRVRLSGKVSWVSGDGSVCYINDGSPLKSDYATSERAGIRVIFPSDQTTTYQLGDFVDDLTGVLGAEMSEDPTPQPVPVLRISRVPVPGAKIIRVKSSGGNDSHLGTNWTTDAMATVQAAVNRAISGDEVWVASGTYNQRITLTSGVKLYGGFAGTEALREQRNWSANLTTLDGQQAGSVVTLTNASAATRIDGFTIQHGSGTTNVYNEVMGGGVYCQSSDPVIANNTIANNSTTYGGGGLALDDSSPILWCNVVSYNTVACIGGGLYTMHGTLDRVIMCGNTFSGNVAFDSSWHRGEGGAMWVNNGPTTVVDNVFNDNQADYVGGALQLGVDCTVIGNTFLHNTVSYNQSYGGAICGGTTISGNRFEANSAVYMGGAVFHSGICTVSNNLFIGNAVAGSSSGGGGAVGFAAYSGGTHAMDLVNNTFADNRTYSAGGTPAGYGGAVYQGGTYAPSCNVLNNIFYNNAALQGQSAYVERGTQYVRFCDAWNAGSNNDASLHYCQGQYGTITVDGPSCFYLDPLFANSVDYRLSFTPPTIVSPCIDKGHNAGASPYAAVPPVDFDGLPRPIDIDDAVAPDYSTDQNGHNSDAFCDMGAYETR